jgi:hypothetical protein
VPPRPFLLLVSLISALLFVALAPSACSDAQRGVPQGIFFDVEGGADAGGGPDGNVDAQGPCAERPDPAGICAQTAPSLYTHFLVCAVGATPAYLECVSTGAASTDGSATFCCTTGLL